MEHNWDTGVSIFVEIVIQTLLVIYQVFMEKISSRNLKRNASSFG